MSIQDDIKQSETYSSLTEEKVREYIKDLSSLPILAIKVGKFPTTEEIEALDDNRTYNIPTPAGYIWMKGSAAKEFNKMMIAEINK